MTLKTKLSWGLGFLFLIIFTLVGFCSYYVGKLSMESENILKDNYNSIVYAKNMLAGLDDMKTSIDSIMYDANKPVKMSDYQLKRFESGKDLFEGNLKKENNNVTEIHEKEYVEKLNQEYATYLNLCVQMKNGSSGKLMFNDFMTSGEKLKQSVNNIYDVNIQAVVRKTELAKHDSAKFKNAMVIIGLICIILALGYCWYFPVYISTTISYLSDRMKNLIKESGVTMDIKTNDEAQIILQSINLLENKLGIKK
jgi:NtrC-family two-component system sensor histidine kinase KinB